jgi:hypothetical protein
VHQQSSSAELNEAINSMFKWYNNARVCYTYLSDFDLDVAESVVSHLEYCRWFTRGWCLQELIAPSELLFYDRNWQFIGTKVSLRGLISRIARIDEEVLIDFNCLYTTPVARRMSWASSRKTTREEDTAYSLLGIFDVNLPMLYGEGTKAFIRLQEEIIKKSNDLSLFAWRESDPERTYVDMLAPSPSCFYDCYNIKVYRIERSTLSSNLFSITNRGLHFIEPDIVVMREIGDNPRSDYVLSLDCYITQQNRSYWMYLLLRKVGPGLFVRINSPWPSSITTVPIEIPWIREKDMFILPNVNPGFYPSITKSHASCFEIHMADQDLLPLSIESLEPIEAWDTTRSRFFTQYKVDFAGYIKVLPQIARIRKANFFVVVLGFYISLPESGLGSTVEPNVMLIDHDIWVGVEAPGRTVKWMVSRAILQQMKLDPERPRNGGKLDLGSYTVTLALQTVQSDGVPVHKVMLDWK